MRLDRVAITLAIVVTAITIALVVGANRACLNKGGVVGADGTCLVVGPEVPR